MGLLNPLLVPRPRVRTATLARLARLGAAVLLAVAVSVIAASESPGGERPTEAEIGKVQVYLTPGQAVREIFEDTAAVDTVRAVLGAADREALHRRLGRAVPADTVVVYAPRDAAGTRLGYAVIGEEVGKYRPITFMVGTDTALAVRGVEILVYRESRGGEVRHTRFLRQYRGKTNDDPVRTNRDILNVAGATLSVTALNHGVKRVLAVLSLLAERNAL
jgi:hypothetical protein